MVVNTLKRASVLYAMFFVLAGRQSLYPSTSYEQSLRSQMQHADGKKQLSRQFRGYAMGGDPCLWHGFVWHPYPRGRHRQRIAMLGAASIFGQAHFAGLDAADFPAVGINPCIPASTAAMWDSGRISRSTLRSTMTFASRALGLQADHRI